ncbi:MAG: indole-3-glycerol phosphate synthase TrpC [Deltaproteobacteria bacterium]|nr:indole-3-glycerol phosphate synthase TrpC [Deltaproteobacteria bacterium]
MILDRILTHKKNEVEELKRSTGRASLERAVRDLPPTRDFAVALRKRECAVIAEIKSRSPSAGTILDNFDHRTIAAIYESHGAAAISVITDRHFFGGDRSFLADIRSTVSLPLLRKDFIIDDCQIIETRALGADAVLLIAMILDARTLRSFIMRAESLGMTPLVEVHSNEDVKRALAAGARVIGINNRDLQTFKTDITVSANLVPFIPEDILVVSESGIRTRNDIDTLMAVGIRAFLVGEALMKAADRGGTLRTLLGRDDYNA